MTKIPIRNMLSHRTVPPRFCDLIIDGEEIRLSRKEGNRYEEIPWNILKIQVEEALEKVQ